MSALFYPHRHHNRQASPWGYYRNTPSSFAISPFYGRPQHHDTDPFGFSQPFLSLFNDTFSQLDRLSSDLDTHLSQTFADGSSSEPGTSWQKLLTSTPKFDVKETETAYVLEGELPGINKKDISLTWADDHTLVLKTQTSSFKEEKPEAPSSENSKQIDSAEGKSPTEMKTSETEGAKAATAGDTNGDATSTAVATTENKNTDVAKPAPAQPTYHLTERTHSTFQRVFSFAGQVKHDEVKAGLKNGVLTITIPKANPEPAKAEKVRSVTVEDADEHQDAEMVDAEKSKL